MVSFCMMGARTLPSLLSLLPPLEIYEQWRGNARLEFYPHLLSEFVLTGNEIVRDSSADFVLRISPMPFYAATR